MSHLPLSIMDRLNKTESAVFKLWLLYFQKIFFFQIIYILNTNPNMNGYMNDNAHDLKNRNFRGLNSTWADCIKVKKKIF